MPPEGLREAIPNVASKNVSGNFANDVEEEEAAKREEVPLTTAEDSPIKEDQASMRFEEQSLSVAATD